MVLRNSSVLILMLIILITHTYSDFDVVRRFPCVVLEVGKVGLLLSLPTAYPIACHCDFITY